MKIVKPEDFILIIKDKYLLLDTNIFIDTSLKPTVFSDFFKEIKSNNTIITTIEVVIIEFLRGIPHESKYTEKQSLLDEIIDITLPISEQITSNCRTLIKHYGPEGKSASVTDLLLGATLMEYKKDIFLLTKNTTDFPMHIFDLVSICNFAHGKSIQTYGLYCYRK